MTKIVPTQGRIVLFCLANYQADEINRRRKHSRDQIDYHRWKKNGTMVHIGNEVKAGDIFPAMVVQVWGDTPECAVNLKVFLDGSDDYWVTSTSVERAQDEGGIAVHTEGRYHWMVYQTGQAAKAEKAESELEAIRIAKSFPPLI